MASNVIGELNRWRIVRPRPPAATRGFGINTDADGERSWTEILRIGRGRATQYGLRQKWPNLEGPRFPLFRISESGAAVSAGELITLAAPQTAWMPMGTVNDGLPAELADARPSEVFLGRHFAAVHAHLRLPPLLSESVRPSHFARDVSTRRGFTG